MAGTAHDVIVETLREDPSLVGALVETLTGRSLPNGLLPVDSTIRFVKVAEVRPDIVLAEQEREWAIVEVQNEIDEAKGRRWLLAASLLFDQTRVLGDVVVITTQRYVAKWARAAACFESKAGTKLTLTPIVLYLGRDEIEKLLDAQRPELALFAAWAMRHRRGPEAKAVVKRSLEVTQRLARPLRNAQRHAILGLLSERMLALFTEASVDISKIPLSEKARKIEEMFEALDAQEEEAEARGEVKGRRAALFALLASRGLEPSSKQRAAIEACIDPATLTTWIVRAASAPSVADAIAPAKQPKAATRKTPPRRVA